jgi:hypothetical protein
MGKGSGLSLFLCVDVVFSLLLWKIDIKFAALAIFDA